MIRKIFLTILAVFAISCGDDNPWKYDPPETYKLAHLKECYDNEGVYTCVYEGRECIRNLEWSGKKWEEGYWICYF